MARSRSRLPTATATAAPEYAYRLEVGPSQPDFAVKLLFGDPNLIRRQARFGQQQRAPRLPGANGSLNLQPGTTTTLNFLVTGEGVVGKIEVRAEGLPEGVTAAPIEVSPAGLPRLGPPIAADGRWPRPQGRSRRLGRPGPSPDCRHEQALGQCAPR